MEKYEYDIEKTMELINDEKKANYSNLYARNSEGYSKLYAKSNEDLKSLFKNFSVKDKNVLSVLASGDQAFTSYYFGAKSVDTFDINYLTEYYYYLRKWQMECKDKYYPDYSRLKSDSSWIGELLKLVECQSDREEMAYKYWSLYALRTANIKGAGIFKVSWFDYSFVVEDVVKMRELIKDRELNFIQEDISGRINKDKKYGVIILSNILEYSSFDIDRLEKCRDNLFDLLEDDGMIVASHLMSYTTAPSEANVFSTKFDSYDFQSTIDDFFGRGYCYTKK